MENSIISKKQEMLNIIINSQMRVDRYWISSKLHKNIICIKLDISQATYYRYLDELVKKKFLEHVDDAQTYFVYLDKSLNYEQ